MKSILNVLQRRKAEFMALNQVYHQYLTSVNQVIVHVFDNKLNKVLVNPKQYNDLALSYQKQLKLKTISLWTDICQSTRFLLKMIFTPYGVSENDKVDIGTLCI